ncbi:DgyrCDS14418 [Dimorphilus gyrociliatus]|uniref:DgyrCDS14418 n=1 Tax=Dimorphilus gyrociliatus TaxID=2664684 RepID=A0A7I8WDJ3_9ANNE|nr:DgyrCDS14418 [Dimorphilus gyrociliatus]
MQSYLTECNGRCNNHKVNIVFQKVYDIVEYCISHAFMAISHKAKEVTVIYNTASNAKNQYKFNLDATNKDVECFLARYTFGENVKSMTFIPVQTKVTADVGFSSIMIFAYEDGIREKVENSNYYTDIANVRTGATCTANSVYSSSYECQYALDFINGAFQSLNEWAAKCTGQACIGKHMEVSFSVYGVPSIFCLANRLQFISKLKVKWSSGLMEIVELNLNIFQKCFKYSKNFIETKVYLEVVEISTTRNIGLSLVQVQHFLFLKDIEDRHYDIHTKDHMQYTIPPYIQNNFQAMTFSVYGSQTASNVCGGIVFNFYRNNKKSFKMVLSNTVESYLEKLSPSVYFKDKLQEYVTCGQWNDFWITTLDGTVKLGKGLIYNRNTRIIAPIVSHGPTDKFLIRNFQTSYHHLLRVNDLEGKVVRVTENGLCTEEYYTEYLYDKLYSTCFVLSKKSTVIESWRLGNLTFNSEDINPEITLYFDKDDKNQLMVNLFYENLKEAEPNGPYLNYKMKPFYIVLMLFFGIFHFSIQTNKKYVNVASAVNGASCTATSERHSHYILNFECENALTPLWFKNDDWASSCSTTACNGKSMTVHFKSSYDVVEVCIIQRIIEPDRPLKEVKIKYGNNINEKEYKLKSITTCLLLEEGLGNDISSMKFTAINCDSTSVDSGFNSVFIMAYSDDPSDIEEEKYINIADLNVGATCSSSSSQAAKPCTNALDRYFALHWTPYCGLPQNCLEQYINIVFGYPAQPVIYAYANIYSTTNAYIKGMRLEWSSGFIDTKNNLPQTSAYQYFNYDHAQTIESSIKVVITDVYYHNSNGLNYFKVFAKQTDENIYSIQSVNDVDYHLPEYLQGKIEAMNFKVKGFDSGSSYDCSSLIINFMSNTTKKFILTLDDGGNDSGISMITVIHPTLDEVEFSEEVSLISCSSWNEYWIEFNNNKIKFGSGKVYGSNLLGSLQTSISLEITKLSIKNDVPNILNFIQITLKDRDHDVFTDSEQKTNFFVISLAQAKKQRKTYRGF